MAENIANRFLVGPILGVFVLAIYVRRAGTFAAWAGVVGGIVIGLIVAFGHTLPVVSLPQISFSLVLPYSAAATIVCGIIAGAAIAKAADDHQ